MMRAGQRCQVKLSRPHVEVSPPVARYSSNAHFTLALVYVRFQALEPIPRQNPAVMQDVEQRWKETTNDAGRPTREPEAETP